MVVPYLWRPSRIAQFQVSMCWKEGLVPLISAGLSQFPGSQQLLSSHPASPQALCMGKTTLLAIQSNQAPSPPPLWSLLQLIFLQSWTPPQSQPWVVAAMAMEEVGMTGLPNTKFQIHSLNQTISPKCLCHVLCLPDLRVSRIKLPLILPSKIQNLLYLEVLLFTCQNVTEFIYVFFFNHSWWGSF